MRTKSRLPSMLFTCLALVAMEDLLAVERAVAMPTVYSTPMPPTFPTAQPIASPTAMPTAIPIAAPSAMPTALPTSIPTTEPIAMESPDDIFACAHHDGSRAGFDFDSGGAIRWDELAAHIDFLIATLGSDDFTARELAKEELYRVGTPALGALIEAWALPGDLEIKRRLEPLIAAISSTGYSGPFRAKITYAYAAVSDVAAIPANGRARIVLQIESDDADISITLQDDTSAARTEQIVPSFPRHVFQAEYRNGAAMNSFDILISNYRNGSRPAATEKIPLQITLPVRIARGCLPGSIPATLVFDIQSVEVTVDVGEAVIEQD